MASGLLAANVAAALISALGTRAVTEVLDPDRYGAFKLVEGAVALANTFLLAPLVQYAMRGLHDVEGSRRSRSFMQSARLAIGSVALATGIVATVGVGVFASSSWSGITVGLIGAGALLLASQSQYNIESAFVTSQGDPLRSARYRAFSRLLTLAALVGAAVIAEGVAVLVLATALPVGALALLLRRKSEVGGQPVDVVNWLRGAAPFALPLLPAAILSWMLAMGDRYLVAILLDTGAAGRYAATYGLVAAPIGILGGVGPSLAYSPLYRSAASPERNSDLIARQLIFAQSALAIVAVLLIAGLGPIAVEILLAPPFREGARSLLPWLAVGLGALMISGSLDLVAFARKTTRRMILAPGAAVAVNFGTAVVLIPRYGLTGAGMAMTAAGLTRLAAMLIFYFPRRPEASEPSNS